MPQYKTYKEKAEMQGLNTLDAPEKLQSGESPYMLNMVIDRKGQVRKRFGYELMTTIGSVTGAIRGAHAFYRTFDTNSGKYLLLYHSDGNGYYITQANLEAKSAPTSMSAYGTDSGKVRAITYDNMAISSNGLAANTIKKWAGTGNLADLGGSPSDAYIFAVFQNRLWGVTKAAPTTIIYSDVGDPESNFDGTNSFAVDLGSGHDIKSMVPTNDNLIVLKENMKYGINITFDSSGAVVAPQLQPLVDSSGGCIAEDTAVPVYNDIFYLSEKGFQAWGNQANYTYRAPRSLSWRIKPTIEEINFTNKDLLHAIFFDEKYYCVAPLGKTAIPYIFIYDSIQQGWTMWNGIHTTQFFKFINSKGVTELYFISNSEPKVYKFNTSFSDDGVGYNAVYKSRTFRFGTKTKWRYIDLYGSMSQGASLTLDVTVDNVTYRDEITNDNLIMGGSGGGYVGDNYVGQSYTGSSVSGSEMYKWHYRFMFPSTINEGRDMYFQISNNEDGKGFSLYTDYEITVEHLSEANTYESSTL